jgi:hypothetical protein
LSSLTCFQTFRKFNTKGLNGIIHLGKPPSNELTLISSRINDDNKANHRDLSFLICRNVPSTPLLSLQRTFNFLNASTLIWYESRVDRSAQLALSSIYPGWYGMCRPHVAADPLSGPWSKMTRTYPRAHKFSPLVNGIRLDILTAQRHDLSESVLVF